jgi:ABC-type multidrug transport system ATPase subunit
LERCADTIIGNNLIKGISGGERKRTSIGVELLSNPSLLFLDEPTTGLDSSTALQVIENLKLLAARGVNVVSTIHQPSSDIFNEFDRLILLVQGNIIFQHNGNEAVNYFSQMGFVCP